MRFVLKTSSVRVATSDQDRVYRSLKDVPPALRDKIQETLEGPNSETILIANQEAYDRIMERMRQLPPEMQQLSQAVVPQRKGSPQRATASWKLVLAGGFSAIALLWVLWVWLIQLGGS